MLIKGKENSLNKMQLVPESKRLYLSGRLKMGINNLKDNR
jgi:hypothetical protein